MRVRGESVILMEDGSVTFLAGMSIDSDGSPRAYAPIGSGLKTLDYLSNAGSNGNWYGIETGNGKRWGIPVVQTPDDPAPGYYVSATAYKRPGMSRLDPRAYLDPEHVPFIVVPGPLREKVKPIVLGCKATVVDIHTGRELLAMVGDIGPATHLGEASIFVAEYFGVNSSPKWGGTNESRFRYTIFPGNAAAGFELLAMG
jgi:hypothetical protein